MVEGALRNPRAIICRVSGVRRREATRFALGRIAHEKRNCTHSHLDAESKKDIQR